MPGVQVEMFQVEELLPTEVLEKMGAVASRQAFASVPVAQVEHMAEADAIIFGTPTFFHTMSAQAKILMDRTMCMNKPSTSLANKVGGIVAVAGSFGLIEVVKDWYFYIVTRGMIPANFIAAYARDPGDVKNLEKCMKAACDMGRQMVLIANKKFEYPKEIARTHIAYGTHTK